MLVVKNVFCMKKSLLSQILTVFSIIVFSTVSLSQTVQSNSVVVFSEENTQEIQISNESVFKNVVKWNIGLLARGTFLFNYEREILDWFSLEGGLGVTYTDPLYFMGAEMSDASINGLYKYNETIQPKYGFAYSLRSRAYPAEIIDMCGFYVALGHHARYYNADVTIDGQTYDTKQKATDVHFLCGWQDDSYFFDEMVFDFYFGVGIRNNHFEYVDYTYHSDGYNDFLYETPSMMKASSSTPVFIAGFKLGYPF